MNNVTNPKKKLKSPSVEAIANLNTKTSITCTNVPEGLFDATAAKKHFTKFGRVQKIRLFPKKQMCIIEYDQPMSVERAVLNAGAFDGFMFDVTRTKPRSRRRSKKDDDPDWVPDSDVEEELSAMSGAPSYRISRQKPMDESAPPPKPITRMVKQLPVKSRLPVREKKVVSSPLAVNESLIAVAAAQTSLSTSEAAAELHQLRSRVSLTPDEQWRTLDARDRLLRAWGGSGSRVKVGGATIGTCPDLCPEKELLHRQAEHQVMTLETEPDSDGRLEPSRAVKQYSRSSADQEIPMCYELRPAKVLMRTCAYLLNEIADTKRQVSLADWFHFMWDRLRGIRKDITQQALCCAESIWLVEMCARFHAHCAARLADLEHTQFDQKLNTDNLTKCLQTLKHMYADVGPDTKPREAEFRGYIALLSLGDANFLWEIKQLPQEIQKSSDITFAIQMFNALDNNNYIRFFRLINQKATYLQACILLRYFNDVRARALARIVKAYAPRGGAKYPIEELMNSLAFESVESMQSFISHYGLHLSRDKTEPSVILDRNQFIEDMDPYPIARAIHLIESKRQCSVGEIIAGGTLPSYNYAHHIPYSSFNKDGKMKETALTAEDQSYDTINDTNKDVRALKAEIQRHVQSGRGVVHKSKPSPFPKIEPTRTPAMPIFAAPVFEPPANKSFLFKPAIPVAPVEVINNSPEKKLRNDKNIFSFSKPDATPASQVFAPKDNGNLFKSVDKGLADGNLFKAIDKGKSGSSNTFASSKLFSSTDSENKDPFHRSENLFKPDAITKKSDTVKAVFEPAKSDTNSGDDKNLFRNAANDKNIFSKPVDVVKTQVFTNKNIFARAQEGTKENPGATGTAGNIFMKQAVTKDNTASNIFGSFKKPINSSDTSNLFTKPISSSETNNLFTKPINSSETNNLFTKPINSSETNNLFTKPINSSETNNLSTNPENTDSSKPKSVFALNGEMKLSPSSLFKSAINVNNTPYSIFQSKNKAPVAENIFKSVNNQASVFDFDQNSQESTNKLNEEMESRHAKEQEDLKREKERQMFIRLEEEKQIAEERKREEEKRLAEERLREQQRKEEEKHREKERKLEEQKRIEEEKQKQEEQKRQEELRIRLENERKAEIKRKAEEEERKFRERVEKESAILINTLVEEVADEKIRDLLSLEIENIKILRSQAEMLSKEILSELCDEICQSEMKAEKVWTEKLLKKWFYIWKKQLKKNFERRTLLENTPVWLADKSPVEEAACLRRMIEKSVLKNMNAIHRGYKFTGELHQLPQPEPFNIVDIIRSSLLKRMKQINYPYDKCFFWKLALVSPGEDKWMCRKIEIHKWILDVFSDRKEHEVSETLIHVEKQSWNHLMDFAISVSLTEKRNSNNFDETLDGTNGILVYASEKDSVADTLVKIFKHKYLYQIIPIAIIMPEDVQKQTILETALSRYVADKLISEFRIYTLDSNNVFDSLNVTSKSAMKWLAKKYPPNPPLEIDYLKSICQRYLGNEIWCRFKIENDIRMQVVSKDIKQLVKCYNIAVDKLAEAITNEDLFNYPSFPLEFKQYLDHNSPYPKPYEFIPTNAKNCDNSSAIKDMLMKLKLPDPTSQFLPSNVTTMQHQIRKYCNQIGWFEDPEKIVCKVVANLPNEFSDLDMPCEQFRAIYEHYNLIEFLNILVYEKITGLNNFDNRFAVYERSALENYRNIYWLNEVEELKTLKHKTIRYEDELDAFIEAKRRKIELDSMEYLELEDKDCTMVEENIKATDESISRYNHCQDTMKQLEKQLDEERQKSIELENLLKSALSNA